MKFPKRFFRKVLGNTLQAHHLDVEIRCLHQLRDEEAFWPKHFWCRSIKELESHWSEIVELNRTGYDIHFTVVPRLREFQGKKEHPLPDRPIVSCLWADLDVGKGKPHKNRVKALERVRELKPRPNIVVKSGSGIHVYYLREKPRGLSKEKLESLLRTLAGSLNADLGAARATRLMRVPNTYNWKRGGQGKRARARYVSKTRHRLKELENLWKTSEAADTTSAGDLGEPAKYADFFAAQLRKLRGNGRGFERTALCPFHNDKRPSFSVNVDSGLWKCHSSHCHAEGNLEKFCKRLGIQLPVTDKTQRFPRLRVVAVGEEWSAEKAFREVHRYLTGQIHFTREWQAVLVAVWAMGTYLHTQFPCYGHLWLNSPTTHSGKSKLLSVLWTLCYKATEPQLEPTSAVLFRFPSVIGGTLLLDEIDNLDPQKRSDVISVLNSYHCNGVVLRATPGKNKKYTLEKLPVYCPKVIAGINNLPVTLQDRCIKIHLHRKIHSEKVERFMPDFYSTKKELRDQLDVWAIHHGMRVAAQYRHHDQLGVPSHVDDRARDILEPLFAIAGVLPVWVKDRLVEASKSISREREREELDSNEVVRCLQILKEHFPERVPLWHLRTEEALDLFSEEIEGVETKARAQGLLRRLGFRSKSSRFGKHVLRAYEIPAYRLEKLLERYGLKAGKA